MMEKVVLSRIHRDSAMNVHETVNYLIDGKFKEALEASGSSTHGKQSCMELIESAETHLAAVTEGAYPLDFDYQLDDEDTPLKAALVTHRKDYLFSCNKSFSNMKKYAAAGRYEAVQAEANKFYGKIIQPLLSDSVTVDYPEETDITPPPIESDPMEEILGDYPPDERI